MEPVNNSSLPLGLIETTREIFLEVASYPVLPPEKIQAYWNAYTITFRTVVDPTALRLENFWWHVWGSDRRYLPGPVLARLFKEFALGPTFAPLVQSQRPPLTWKPTSDQNHNQQQKSSPSESRKERGSASSSSKYPPAPRPILKKNRGPSGSGPRPTARFLDPPTTHERKPGGDNSSPPDTAAAAPREIPSSTSHKQDDAEPQAAIPQDTPSSAAKPEPGPLKEMPPPPKPPPKRRTSSTPAASTSGTDMRPPRQTSPASGGKVTLPTGKKIVASTAASRRRPIMPRRQSSQSTAGSPTTRLVSPVGTTAVKQGGTRRPSTEAKASEETAITESPQASESQLSEKAADKRPMREPSQTSPQKASPSLRPTTKSSSTQQKTVQTDGPWNQPEKPLPTRRRGSAKQEAPQPQVKAVMQTQVIYGFNPPCQRPALQEKQNVPQTKVAQNNAQITQSRPPVAGFVTEAAQQQQQQQQQRAGNRNTRGNVSQEARQVALQRHHHPQPPLNPTQPNHPQGLPRYPMVSEPLPDQERQVPLSRHPVSTGGPNFAQPIRPQGRPDIPIISEVQRTQESQAMRTRHSLPRAALDRPQANQFQGCPHPPAATEAVPQQDNRTFPRQSHPSAAPHPAQPNRQQGPPNLPMTSGDFPTQERQVPPSGLADPAQGLNPVQANDPQGLPGAPMMSGVLQAPGRARTSRYPPTASRAYPAPPPPAPPPTTQRQSMNLVDTTHFRSRSLQRPPSSSKSLITARRRSSMDPKPSTRDGDKAPTGSQTLQRRPLMAAFIPKHPIETSQTDRIRSYIEVMAAPSAAGVITPTNVEGRIASDTLIYPDTLPEARDLPDKVRYAKPPLSSVLEPKFKPTPRDPKPHLQFGRSRSELFLLLERSGGSNGGSAASRPPV